MKKLIFALMAVLATVLSSCSHDTCTLYVENNYSQKAIVLFSHDKDCRDIESAELFAIVKPATMAAEKGVNVKDLHAIFYVCEVVVEKGDETLEGYKCLGSYDLSEYFGDAIVTVKVDERGMPGFASARF